MIQAINRATLKNKLANSNIQFTNYDEYERIQGLIVPVDGSGGVGCG